MDSAPAYTVAAGDVTWWFHLCELAKGDMARPAWILRWTQRDKPRPWGGYLEVASRVRLPDEFRVGDLRLTVFPAWSDAEREEWLGEMSNFKWFQTFPWCPPRADGRPTSDDELIWGKIAPRTGWELRRVLDLGCHTGWYAMRAAKAGAAVHAVDPNRPALRAAQDIAHHIERQDVSFADVDDGAFYDTILYLSVEHQRAPDYSLLEVHLEDLRARCRDLFVELIVPPLEGSMAPAEIDKIVGGEMLLEYRHRIRGTRRLYHVRATF